MTNPNIVKVPHFEMWVEGMTEEQIHGMLNSITEYADSQNLVVSLMQDWDEWDNTEEPLIPEDEESEEIAADAKEEIKDGKA